MSVKISELQKLLAAAMESHRIAVHEGQTGILGDDDERTGPDAARQIPDCTYQPDPDVAQFQGDRWAFSFTYSQSYP